MYFFRDSNAVRFPDDGKTKIQISADGKNWTDLAATETIAAQESSDRVKPYTYDFAPVGATFVKVTVTNADTTTPSGRGLRRPDRDRAEDRDQQVRHEHVRRALVADSERHEGLRLRARRRLLQHARDHRGRQSRGEGNASVTVLPAHDNVIRVITESEDHVTRKTFTINLARSRNSPQTPMNATTRPPT